MFKTVIVIPCYKVEKYIIHVLKKIPLRKIFKVILVDDNCPNNTGKYVKKKIKNKKIKVIFLKKNLGVGGATKAGIKDAIKHKADIIIKLDGDGQHNPVHLSGFINLQKKNPNTYIKGFRELDYKKIPFSRYLGNIVITFILRFLTNNQNLKDVVNGFISIPRNIYTKINFKKISDGYFFEQDLIFQLSLKKFNIKQKKISTIYNNNIKSSLNEFAVIFPFLLKYISMIAIKIKNG